MSGVEESGGTEKDGQRSKHCCDYAGFDKTVYTNNIKNTVRKAPKNHFVEKGSLNYTQNNSQP